MGVYATRLASALLLLFSSHFTHALAVCDETNTCTHNILIKGVTLAFTASNITIEDLSELNSDLNAAYGNFSARCLGVSQNVSRAARLLTPALSDNVQLLQQQLSLLFTQTTGYRVEYTMQTPSRIAEEVLFQVQTNVSLYDAWVLDVLASEAPLRAGAVAPLDRMAATEAAQELLQDRDVHPFLQKYGAMHGGNRTAVVLSGMAPLLYWRRDLFAAANLTAPPTTWEELLAVAAALNGTDLDGDGRPDAALCWQTEECVDASTLLGNILASMTQYQGSDSGWLLKPEDMSPLAAGLPLQRALELLRNLTRLEARGPKGCAFLHSAFFNGTCALTIQTAQQFKVAELRYPHLHGKVGVAPLPGSAWVWDRAAGAWLSCGSETDASPCPHATLETPLALPTKLNDNRDSTITNSTLMTATTKTTATTMSVSENETATPRPSPSPTTSSAGSFMGYESRNSSSSGSGSSSTSSGSLSWRRMATAAPAPPPAAAAAEGFNASAASGTSNAAAVPAAARRVWVNRAPYCGVTVLVGSVDVRSPADYAHAAFFFFSMIASPNVSWALMGTDSVVGPFRRQHLDSANLSRWLAMNYSREDVVPFLESTRLALEHPNAALPLRLPGASGLRDVLYWASQQVLVDPTRSLAAVVEETWKRLQAALDVGLSIREVQQVYWDTIGFKGSKAAPPPSPRDRSSWFAARATRIGVSLAVAITGTALAALAAGLWHRRRQSRRQRTLFGRAMAPGASPATSLVVTDIVDSTRLWETVSSAAMTRAVQLHHETLRSLLQLHNGYESATEGDAFILSFYSAADAVAFALRAQAALLYQPWPEELFQHEPCRPQYAVCQMPGAPADRPRAAIPRGPRGGTFGTQPSLGSQPAAADECRSGGGGLEEHLSGSWWAVGNAQPLSSAKLRRVTNVLSLPLKRRPWRAYGGGGSCAGTSLPGHASVRQLTVSTTPQLPYKPVPAVPSLQPPDGFASHSLSQILLSGAGSIRSGGAVIGGGSGSGGGRGISGAGADGSTGGGGGGGSRNRRRRPASQREPHGLRRQRLWTSSSRNDTASIVPYNRLPWATLGGTHESDASGSDGGGSRQTAAIEMINTAAAVAAAGAAAAATSTHSGSIACVSLAGHDGGSGNATVTAAAAIGVAEARDSYLSAGGGGGGGSVGGSGVYVGGTASAPIPVAAPCSPAEVAVSSSHSFDGGGTGAGGGNGDAPAAAAAAVVAPAVEDGQDNEKALVDASGNTSALVLSAAKEDSPGAAAGGGGGFDSDALSVATFSGLWIAQGPPPPPPPAPADAAATATAAEIPRAAMSLPLSLLATGTVVAAAVATASGDGVAGFDDEGLLAIREKDIREVPNVESDPELSQYPDGDPERYPLTPCEPPSARSAHRRARGLSGSRLRGRMAALHALGLGPMHLVSEGGSLGPSGVQGETVAAAAATPARGISAGGFAASAAAAAICSGVTSGSGVLSGSLGLMPYRRTSVPNHLAALMASGAAGTSFGGESGVLSSGSGGRGPIVRSLPLGAYYQQMFRSCQPGAPGAVLVAGGLSVRMGMHSGVASTQVSYNRVAGRTQYSGAALEAAKAVCDAAQGGMVLLSSSAFEQLALGRAGGPSSGREPPVVVLHIGRHVIKALHQAQQLYMAQSRELLSRLAFLGPVRSSEQLEPGALEAPLGEVSMGFVMVVGLPTLMAWNKETTEDALSTFQQVVVAVAMRRLGGHLVEEGPGRVLAAFGHPFDAIRWVAACEALLKEADWSESLLSHELAEEVQGPVLLDSHVDAPVMMGDGEMSRMLFRGLRIKGAVDCARVKAELVPSTGRLSYRGNLAQNVERIAAFVSTGQVVCTRRAWRGYEAALDLAAQVAGVAEVVGACLGLHPIRGVGDKVELWSIRLEDLTYETYHQDMVFGNSEGGGDGGEAVVPGGGGGGLRLLLPSPPTAAAAELASPAAAAAALGGDVVGSRLGASLAVTMAAQSRVWSATGEELRNMMSE